MFSEISINVENISKCYQIYDHPRDRLRQFFVPRLMRAFGRPSRQYFREFWALKDVSFKVKKGETVGIIGRNGSGKSTLLQLICGTLNSTAGDIVISGRIAALLELGSGFNPEFTGRENVYLNASILGLTKEEIDARFDKITSFADIGEFIEQPVKAYSSGMIVRLAFAVIAHVDAEVLIIDEALAVGDAVFIQKCMRFIRSFQQQGTLLFVSHDMSSVASLCRSAIWLDGGRIRMSGEAKVVSQAYLQHTLQGVYGNEAQLHTVGSDEEVEELQGQSAHHRSDLAQANAEEAEPILDYGACYKAANNLHAARGFRTGKAELTSVEIENLSSPSDRVFKGGERVRLTVCARAIAPLDKPILGFSFNDRLGQVLFGENTLPFTALSQVQVAAGEAFKATFTFRLPMVPNGDYSVFASVAQGELRDNIQHHLLHDALVVKVTSSKVRWGLVGVPFESVDLKVGE